MAKRKPPDKLYQRLENLEVLNALLLYFHFSTLCFRGSPAKIGATGIELAGSTCDCPTHTFRNSIEQPAPVRPTGATSTRPRLRSAGLDGRKKIDVVKSPDVTTRLMPCRAGDPLLATGLVNERIHQVIGHFKSPHWWNPGFRQLPNSRPLLLR